MRQANAKMIPIRGDKDLRFMPQTPERNGMDNPVPIPLKFAARAANARARFSILPPSTGQRITGKGSSHRGQLSTRSIS
jgi:hypothetical protein